MPVPLDAAAPTDGVFGLLSVVGDGFAGRRLGFGVRRAAVAARFARHRGGDEGALTANWIAGALAEIGNLDVLVPRDASERVRLLATADAPVHGARFVAALPGMPPGAADMIRWHREHEDGTGYPDRLRWDGIPADAAALGIVTAFLEAVEETAEPRAPGEALFTLFADTGRRFRVELVRAFQGFVMSEPAFDAPFAAALPTLDEDAILDLLATRIDVRDGQTVGRTERLVAVVVPLATRLRLDAARAGRLARLFALGRITPHAAEGSDHRSEGARAATFAASVPRYAEDATLLAAVAGRPDQCGNPLTSVLALGVALDAVPPGERASWVASEAGRLLDAEVTRVYLASSETPG
jgi:hypothetical protein